MGPLCRFSRIFNPIRQVSSFVSRTDLYQSQDINSLARSSKLTFQTGSGKGKRLGQSRLLQPDFPGPKKDRKVTFGNRLVPLERVYSPGLVQDGNDSVDQECYSATRLDSIHRSNGRLPPYSDTPSFSEISPFCCRGSVISVPSLTVRPEYCSSSFHKADERNYVVFTSSEYCTVPLSRRLVDKECRVPLHSPRCSVVSESDYLCRSDSQLGEIRPSTISEFHFYRNGVSDCSEYSQIASGTARFSNRDCLSLSAEKPVLGARVSLPSGQAQCGVRSSNLGSTSSTPSPDVSTSNLEASYLFTRGQNMFNGQHPFSTPMVVESEPPSSRSPLQSPRPHSIPVHRCEFCGLGSSSGASGTHVSWCLVGRTICSSRQYPGNASHRTCVGSVQQFHSPFLCPRLYRQLYGSCLSKETGGDAFSESMRNSMENPPLVSNSACSASSSTYSREVQCIGRPFVEAEQTNTDRMVSEALDSSEIIQTDGISVGRFVRHTAEQQTTPLRIPCTGHKSVCHRRNVPGLEQSTRICVSTISNDSSHFAQDSNIMLQNSVDRTFVATKVVVHRSDSAPGVTSSSTSAVARLTVAGKRKVSAPERLNAESSRMGVIQQSVRANNFSAEVAEMVATSRRPGTNKIYDAKWSIFVRWCHRRKIDPIEAPINSIADFLLYLFRARNCQMSTIKGYRSAISNTLRFVSGRTVGSHPVLSELIRSMELRRPVYRPLTPRWNLSWVLICLGKHPFEPLHKASMLHVTMKTVFLLAFASSKRRCEIHALSASEDNIRFNKTDGSVSLQFVTGFLAKTQLPSVSPDPIVIPCLSKTLNNQNPDRLLCPVRALKFYIRMTKPFRKGRDRLFLSIRGNRDVSKATISRWIVATVKLAYSKLTSRDISLMHIKAHDLRAFSSSWAYLSKACLEDILRAAVWNRPSTFSRFYLRDMSRQSQALNSLGQVVAAQKVVGGRPSFHQE